MFFLEVMREILHLESKEFGECLYLFDFEVGGNGLKWITGLGKFRKQILHFIHSLEVHHQMDTLFSMVLRDKKVDNYGTRGYQMTSLKCMLLLGCCCVMIEKG